MDVEGIKSSPHPCDFNFFSILSDDDGPYASATEEQEHAKKETQPTATSDIQQISPTDKQQQQPPQTLPTAASLQHIHENSAGDASNISTEPPAPGKETTTTTPTDTTTTTPKKQEPTSQDIHQPPSKPDTVNKPLQQALQVNIPTRIPTRPILVTTAPGTQQLFVDPSSDEESLVEMKDLSAVLKRQHKDTPPSHTNSPKDKPKNKRLLRKKSAKKGR